MAARVALLGPAIEGGRLPVAAVIDPSGRVLSEEATLPPEGALRAEFGADVWRPRLPWPPDRP
jgi:hypothetical protein